MMRSQLMRKHLLLIVVALFATACQIPRRSTSTTPRIQQGTIPAVAKEMTPTATPIVMPTAGPTATATPEPLAQPDPEQATTLMEEGRTLFWQSDLAGAESALINAIAADSTYLPAHLYLTEVYLYWPHYWSQALAQAETTAALAPDDPAVLANLAWAQQGAHRFDEAKETVLRAVELDSDSAIAHAAAADVLSSVYQLDDAYDHAQQAVQLDAESAEAWATLGSVAFTLAYWDEAGDAYARAAELQPDFFAWHLLLARHELNVTGDTEIALDLIEPARATQPDHPWIIAFDVDIATERNDWADAEAGCTALFVFNQPHTPYPDAYSCMAGLLILQERYEDAERFQEIAESIAAPERFDVTLLRMRLYNEADECDKGRELAEDWLAQRPYSTLAVRMIGVSYLCEEDFTKAIDSFQTAVEALPRSVGDARLLANAYARDGKASAALAAINRVRAFAAMDPLYYQGLYEVNLFLGNTKEALSAAQRWQVLRPESIEARGSLALVQLFEGNTDAAQVAAAEAIEAGDTSSSIYTIYGETFSRQGRYAEAEEYLLRALALEPDHFLARNFITSLYLAQGECDKVEPHIEWLLENEEDEERAARYTEILADCRQRASQFQPDPATALEDDTVLNEARTQLESLDVEVLSVRFSEEAERSLVVAYNSALDPTSADFIDQEREISLALATLLPRISSQPVGLIVLSGADDTPKTFTYIATRAAFLWRTGELSDEEFIDTWYQESAEKMMESQ